MYVQEGLAWTKRIKKDQSVLLKHQIQAEWEESNHMEIDKMMNRVIEVTKEEDEEVAAPEAALE